MQSDERPTEKDHWTIETFHMGMWRAMLWARDEREAEIRWAVLLDLSRRAIRLVDPRGVVMTSAPAAVRS